MSEYIGSIGTKVSVEVVLVNDYSYVDRAYSYYGTTHYIYTMKDAEGNLYVWKTTSSLTNWQPDGDACKCVCIHKGDTMIISGTVKEHSEYKGEKQTVLTRCKFSLVAHKQNKQESKAQAQKASLAEGDFIWEMPYRQYKQHYSDCETIAGSYDEELGTVDVIIRAGRLKNSGTRGKHFMVFKFTFKDGKYACFRAVSEENAEKQMLKMFPNAEGYTFEYVHY